MLALRHRVLALTVLIVGAALIPAYLLARDTEAEATVIPSRLEVPESTVADYAKRVFASDAVAEKVAEILSLNTPTPVDPEDVPDLVTLETEPGSAVLHVIGHAKTAEGAAGAINIAGTTARVLANELTGDVNLIDDGEPGGGERLARPANGAPGIGVFDSTGPVTVTSEPHGADALAAVLGVGVVYGLILAGLLLLPRYRAPMDV